MTSSAGRRKRARRGGERAAQPVATERAWSPVAAGFVAAGLLYLFISPAPMNAADPFLAAVGLHVLAFAVIATWIADVALRRRLPPATLLDWPLLLACVAYGAGVVFSQARGPSIDAGLLVLLAVVAAYALSDMSLLSATDLVYGFMAAALLAAVWALRVVGEDYVEWLQLASSVEGLEASEILPPTVPRVHDVGDHANIIAMVFVLALPFFVVEAARTPARWLRRALSAGALVLLAATFFTLSRSAWVGIVAGGIATGVSLLLARRQEATVASKEERRRLRTQGVALGVVAVVALAGAAGAVLTTAWRPQWLFRNSLSARQDAFDAGWEMFADHPLTGAGPGTYPILYPEHSGRFPLEAIHAHNGLLQAAVDAGVFGALAAVLIAVAAAMVLRGTLLTGDRTTRWTAAACTGALVGFAIHNLADSANPWKSSLAALAVVLAITLRNQREGATQAPAPLAGLPRRLRAAPALGLIALAPLLALAAARSDVAHYYYRDAVDAAAGSDYAQAYESAERAARIGGAFAVYELEAGLVGMQSGATDARALDDAIEHLERAAELDPRSALHEMNLALALARAGRADEAGPHALRATELADTDYLIYVAAGTVLEEAGADDDAIRAYRMAIERNVLLLDSAFWTGSEFRRERYPEILASSVLIFNPCAQALLLVETDGRTRATELTLDELTALCEERAADTEAIDPQLDLALVRIDQGDLARAREHIDAALARQADHARARRVLGEWHAAADDVAAAREEWTAAAGLGDVEAALLLGQSYPPNAVPDAVIDELARLSSELISPANYRNGTAAFRLKYGRGAPLVALLPGEWNAAVPRLAADVRQALSTWR
jgi:O-antigen ligase